MVLQVQLIKQVNINLVNSVYLYTRTNGYSSYIAYIEQENANS